jgi:hypothetical protein
MAGVMPGTATKLAIPVIRKPTLAGSAVYEEAAWSG